MLVAAALAVCGSAGAAAVASAFACGVLPRSPGRGLRRPLLCGSRCPAATSSARTRSRLTPRRRPSAARFLGSYCWYSFTIAALRILAAVSAWSRSSRSRLAAAWWFVDKKRQLDVDGLHGRLVRELQMQCRPSSSARRSAGEGVEAVRRSEAAGRARPRDRRRWAARRLLLQLVPWPGVVVTQRRCQSSRACGGPISVTPFCSAASRSTSGGICPPSGAGWLRSHPAARKTPS